MATNVDLYDDGTYAVFLQVTKRGTPSIRSGYWQQVATVSGTVLRGIIAQTDERLISWQMLSEGE